MLRPSVPVLVLLLAWPWPVAARSPKGDDAAAREEEPDEGEPEEEEPAEEEPAREPGGEAVALYRPSTRVEASRSVSTAEARTLPGSLGDPVRALQNLPGLTRSPLDAGWLLVRGGDPGHTLVTLEGAPIPLLLHLGGLTTALHPDVLQEVELFPGTPPARLGPALSGAVEIEPRDLGDQPRATAGVNLVWAHAFAEAPVGERGAVAVAARRSYLDGVLALALDPERAGIAPRFADALVRVEAGRVRVTAFGMTDGIDLPASEGQVLTVTQRAAQLQVHGETPVGWGDLEGTGWIGLRDHALSTEFLQETQLQWLPGGRLSWSSPRVGRWRVQAGAEGQAGHWRVEREGDRRDSPWSRLDPFVEARRAGRVAARVGFRGESFAVPGQLLRVFPAPRAAIRWRATSSLDLLAEAGRFSQPPPLLHVLGLPEGAYQPLQQASSAAVGARWTRGPVAVDLDLWARHMEGLSVFEADGSLGDLQGRAGGVEGQVRWTGRGEVRAVAQVGRSERREEPNDPWTAHRYDQPLRLALLGTHPLGRGWTLAGRFRYGSGYAWLASEPLAFDILTQEEREVAVGDDGRAPPFYALDLKLSRRVTLRRLELDLWLDVQNATWRRVPEPAINGFDDRLPAYGYGLPLLPVFGVEGRIPPSP